tara:strand:+ start:583 stop:1104 length:522 start_codon:yes stop_codon:yes gene_type:complete
MTGQINVNKIAARSGNTITINSGDKISGAAGSIIAPGQVIQLVQQQTNTVFSTTSSSYVDTGFAASITPKFSSSKIYVIAGLNMYNNATNGVSSTTLYRGDSRVSDSATYGHAYGYSNAGAHVHHHTFTYLDSPNTTSSTEYKIYISCYTNGGTLYMCINNSSSTLTLMEIAQ